MNISYVHRKSDYLRMNLIYKQLYSLLCLGLVLCSWVGRAQTVQEGRVLIDFSSGWQFRKDFTSGKDSNGREQKWEKVNLPHSWNIADVMDDKSGYYRGGAHYQNDLDWKAEWQNKRILLHVGAANQEAAIFVNGQKVADHKGGYTAFRVDITDKLYRKENAKNKIVIRVNNRFNKDIAPLSGDFTFFGGIYRPISLLLLDQVHFTDTQYGSNGLRVNAQIDSKRNAVIHLRGDIQNCSAYSREVYIESELLDATGILIKKMRQKVVLKPGIAHNFHSDLIPSRYLRFWSPESPYLYRLITSIYRSDGRLLDRVENTVGLRYFSFDSKKGFFLNGQPLKLIGASRHQDFEGMGNAVPDTLQIKDLVKLKAMGGNFLRVAHYPQDPAILSACDSLGLLASVEIPLVNEITESTAFTEHSFQMLKEMIRQYGNHPSVIIWGYMNEIFLRPHYQKDKQRQEKYFISVVALAKALEKLTRTEDSTRYTMIANHGNVDLYHRTGLTKVPMLVGWNLYPGWYGGTIADFGKQLAYIHQQLPDKPLLVTEYGADADYRIQADTSVRFDKSVNYALMYHQGYLNDILLKNYVAGGVAWNLSDFNSETREESMPHINTKGLLTWGRKAKDTYFLYQAYLRKQPFVKIGTTYANKWGARSDSNPETVGSGWLRLPIFTNSDSVKLLLDGRSMGTKIPKDKMIVWALPVTRGRHLVQALASHRGKLSSFDSLTLDCEVMPYDLRKDEGWEELHINVGDNRQYTDSLGNQWFPDQPYTSNSWGYIRGEKYRLKNTGRQNLGSDVNIRGTWDDPLFQTQLQGLEAYRFDLLPGDYEIELFFTELEAPNAKENLIYDLEQQGQQREQQATQRVFDIEIGSRNLAAGLNVLSEVGPFSVLRRQYQVKVKDENHLTVSFNPRRGKTMLSAIRLKKINIIKP